MFFNFDYQEPIQKCYIEWHEGYREYQHIRLGRLKDEYDSEVNKVLARILVKCSSDDLNIYKELINNNDGFIGNVHMGIVVKAAFFLYEKNFKRYFRPLRIILGVALSTRAGGKFLGNRF